MDTPYISLDKNQYNLKFPIGLSTLEVSEMDYSFGNWMKRRRKALDMTQQDLAQKVGCSISAIFKIESDERRPSRQIAELLATHLEIPQDQINLFLKVARQEKAVDHLEVLPPLLTPRFAPASALPKNSLPVPPTPLIGREYELNVLTQQLQDPQCRLLTLTGLGGVGKTRLAIEIARRLQEKFVDGVYFISLAGVTNPEHIIPATVSALGVALPGPVDQKTQVLQYLRDKDALLVFDNLEHLVVDDPNALGIGFLGELLQRTYRVKLVTTSRQHLQLQAEWTFEVQGLPVPRLSQMDEMESSSSAKLFIQRARQARVGFSLAENERPAVLKICQLVEGLPLGIELAAAWIRSLSCREIAEEIEKGFNILSTNARDLPERHRSFQATMDHSWRLLSIEEKYVLGRLSIFRGSIDREAAYQVSGATLPVLSALVDKSLLRRIETGRFDLHELIRQYAQKQLIASGDFNQACDQHLEYFLRFAEETEPKLYGSDQLIWLERLQQDNDNLRVALEWSLRNGNPQKSLQLASKLFLFWERRAQWKEGRKWLQRTLARSDGLPRSRERVAALNAAARLAAAQADTQLAFQLAEENLMHSRELTDSDSIADALNTLGFVTWKQKKYAEARKYCEEGLALLRQLDNPFNVANSLHTLGHIAINQDDYAAAQSYLEESLLLCRKLGNKIGIDEVLGDLGLLAYLQNDFDSACSILEESLVRFREAASISGIEATLNRLGDLARCKGDYDLAGKLYAESLALNQEMGDKDEISSLLHNLGYVAKHHGDYSQALALFKEGLALQQEMGNNAGVAECLTGIAAVLIEQGKAEHGARLFGAAEALREAVGATLWPANRIEYAQSLALLGRTLDEVTLATTWNEGRAISLEQALVRAKAY